MDKTIDVPHPQQMKRDVDVLRVPKAKKVNSTPQKLTQSKIGDHNRKAVVAFPVDLPVSVEDVVIWASTTPGIKFVKDVMDSYPLEMDDPFLVARNKWPKCKREAVDPSNYHYNFAVPRTMVTTLMSALMEETKNGERYQRLLERKARQGEANTSVSASHVNEIMLPFSPDLTPFTSRAVYALNNFYLCADKCNAWIADMRWLCRDWNADLSGLTEPLELFWMETKTANLSHAKAKTINQECATEVTNAFESASFDTLFTLLSTKSSVRFGEIVGYVARARMLNDAVFTACCQAIYDSTGDSYCIDSQAFRTGFPSPPTLPNQADAAQ